MAAAVGRSDYRSRETQCQRQLAAPVPERAVLRQPARGPADEPTEGVNRVGGYVGIVDVYARTQEPGEAKDEESVTESAETEMEVWPRGQLQRWCTSGCLAVRGISLRCSSRRCRTMAVPEACGPVPRLEHAELALPVLNHGATETRFARCGAVAPSPAAGNASGPESL